MNRYFSLEMKSREFLDKIEIKEGSGGVLLEGNLGAVEEILLIEDKLLEFKCARGVWRFSTCKAEILKALTEEVNKTRIKRSEKFEKNK